MIRKVTLFLTFFLLTGCVQASVVSLELEFLKDVRSSYALGEQWLISNVRDKGLFHYIYHPKTDKYPNSNNAIRQLMASRLLAELTHEKPELIGLHRKNLSFVMEYWYKEENGLGYVFYTNKSKLGANAMLLRTLVQSPFFEEYSEQAKKLVQGILSLMNEEGAFHPWFKEPDYDYNKDYLLTFYSGEALLSLVEYYEKTHHQDILEKIIRTQDFYVDRYVNNLEEHYYPAYVPWHTLSLNKLWKITKNSRYSDAIFVLNDELLKIQDTTSVIGRFYNPDFPQYGTAHASSDGVYTEGLVYAYEIALLTGDTEHQELYKNALEIAIGNLITLQYTEETTAQYERPDRAIGALKYSVDRSGIRIDTVQHTLDAYIKILEVF